MKPSATRPVPRWLVALGGVLLAIVALRAFELELFDQGRSDDLLARHRKLGPARSGVAR